MAFEVLCTSGIIVNSDRYTTENNTDILTQCCSGTQTQMLTHIKHCFMCTIARQLIEGLVVLRVKRSACDSCYLDSISRN